MRVKESSAGVAKKSCLRGTKKSCSMKKRNVKFAWAPIVHKVLKVEGERKKCMPTFTAEQHEEMAKELKAFKATMNVHEESKKNTSFSVPEQKQEEVKKVKVAKEAPASLLEGLGSAAGLGEFEDLDALFED